MNAKHNAVLDNIRKTLEQELEGKNLQNADINETDGADEGVELTEAEMRFCEDGMSFIQTSKYELENFNEYGPDHVIEALEMIAEDDPELAPAIEELFKKHNVVEVEA